MKLSFVYVPVRDLNPAVSFYRDTLGLVEAWREGTDTVAFTVPGGDTELMISTTDRHSGPMYQVDDLTAWLTDHPHIPVVVDRYDITGGSVAGLTDPAGNVFYVYDQPGPA